MDMAERFGKASKAVRLKVGALIVKDGGIISEGVNGMPPKWPTEICEDEVLVDEGTNTAHFVLVTKPECRHAEIAALEKMWNKSETLKGSEMFVSHCPCLACAIKLKTAGIIKVYYRHTYRLTDGINYLLKNDVEVERVGELID